MRSHNVQIDDAGFALVTQDNPDEEHCFDCCGEPYATRLTREEAICAANELLAIANSLISDEQAEIGSALNDAFDFLFNPEPVPLTITGFAGPFCVPGSTTEIVFGIKEIK